MNSRTFSFIFFIIFSISSIAKSTEIIISSKLVLDTIVGTQNAQIVAPKHPKATAAILALTLGMLGVHRLYLGSKPWIPLFYVFSVGGVFFILPLIDFIAIMSNKDITQFYNNNKIMMWLK